MVDKKTIAFLSYCFSAVPILRFKLLLYRVFEGIISLIDDIAGKVSACIKWYFIVFASHD